MDRSDIFVKTAKGIEEVAKRTYRLDSRHRIALIQVDGHSAVEMLVSRIPGDGFTSLEELRRDGFIAQVGGKPTAPPGSATASTSPSAAFDLEQAKQRAAKTIDSLLGPDGDSLALAIERTKTVAEFTARAERARDIIGQMRGAGRAKEFWTATGL